MITTIDRFEEWLTNKNLKPRTIENYIYYFNKFTYNKFNQETVSKFLSQKENRNSIGRSFLVNLKLFLMQNYKELGIPKDEALEDISLVELPKLTGRSKVRLIRPIRHDQIELLERFLDSEQLKLQLLLSYYCGLRLGELLKITINSFNWEVWKKDTSQIGECIVYGKGDKEGLAYVPSELMMRIAKYIQNNNFDSLNSRIFVSGRQNIDLKNKARTWQLKLREAGIKSGVTKLDQNGEPIEGTVVYPHRLRHSYATHLKVDLGLDTIEIKELMRHSSIQSTQIYEHLDKGYLKEKLKEL